MDELSQKILFKSVISTCKKLNCPLQAELNAVVLGPLDCTIQKLISRKTT